MTYGNHAAPHFKQEVNDSVGENAVSTRIPLQLNFTAMKANSNIYDRFYFVLQTFVGSFIENATIYDDFRGAELVAVPRVHDLRAEELPDGEAVRARVVLRQGARLHAARLHQSQAPGRLAPGVPRAVPRRTRIPLQVSLHTMYTLQIPTLELSGEQRAPVPRLVIGAVDETFVCLKPRA
jgi:hypothetical protein